MKELPSRYDPAAYEDEVYRRWESSGAFRPAADTDLKAKQRKPYAIVMPPPNATGVLHVGHALMIALEDPLVRYHRMKGFDTLYLPGTDHAAIATATVVDRELATEGKTRHDIGRAAFEKRAKALALKNKTQIELQIRALGASADWTRNAFTIDAPRQAAVKEAFRRLYDKDLIYRGDYMVNWCPACRTVLADDEVEHEEQEGVLYFMKYGPFELATTRPETKVGDTAVAVHPRDKRYKKLVGTLVEIQTINGPRKLKVIADEMVDPEFGTGVVKITPFHDRNDYEVYRRHPKDAGPPLEVIGEDGVMTRAAGELAGLDRFSARKKMVTWLKKEGLLVREELHRHSVGRCYRSGDVVEPRISRQWFVRVSKIAKQAVRFVDQEELKFVPARFEKTYRDWLGNLHDWCISRQVWFGHPLPAFENAKGDVSLTKQAGFKPVEDTLDTWFSSALWPFSTLGWPKETPDFKRYFPGAVLETGYDIIFFWITRMVLMTIALDVKDPTSKKLRPPFHTAYLHGLVRDKRGRKFSKSLGNGIDPLEMIGKYGSDALRFALATSSTPGADIRFDEERVLGARNFANKLWNISRFVIAQEDAPGAATKLDPPLLTTFDRAILHRLRETAALVEDAFRDPDDYAKTGKEPVESMTARTLNAYDLGQAGNRLQEFLWSDFADWYLEAAKVQLSGDGRQSTLGVLHQVLEASLALLHPFMPFITETIWEEGLGKKNALITADWPQLHESLNQPEDAERFAAMREIVEAIRRLRAEKKVAPGARIEARLFTDEPAFFEENAAVLKQLARLSSLAFPTGKPQRGAVATVVRGIAVELPLSGLADTAAESTRLQAEIAEATMTIERLKQRLANKEYAAKAPKQVVAQTRQQLKEVEAALKKLAARRR